MAERERRPVSETIESGFSVQRRAGGYGFKVMCNELTGIALGHSGVKLYYPTYNAAHPRRAEARLVKSATIIGKSAQVGHLNRVKVYETLERNVPLFNEWLNVRADRLQPEEDGIGPGGDSMIAIDFDKESGEKLRRENYAIGSELAGLADLPMDDLDWSRQCPDLVLAYISRRTPDEVTRGMREAVQEHLSPGLDLRLGPVRLLPRLPSRPA